MLAAAMPARAEPVSINNGIGMGYSFTYRNNCYVILPDHVSGRSPRISLRGTASTGDAAIFFTFEDNPDLAVATVTSGLEGDCSDDWSTLSPDLQQVLDVSDTGLLIRVTNGDLTRDEMVVTEVGFATITAELASPGLGDPIQQGTSGSMLTSGRTIIGMAIEYDEDTGQATFLRMDEIVARVGRVLNRPPPTPSAPSEDTVIASSCSPGSIPIRAVQCSVEPVSPEFGCSNLITGGPVIFAPGSRPKIVLELDGEAAPAVGELAVATDEADTASAKPKAILVEMSNTRAAPRWRRFAAADMSPLGAFSVANGSRPFARHLALTLQSAWDDSLPIRLDCVAVN